ncbi:MAG: DNA recombination protein RmuC [Pseudomonadota bacterium]
MNYLFVIAATLALITLPLSVFLFTSSEKYRKRCSHFELQNELLKQKAEENERRMLDWENYRKESMQAAKASILEAGSQLSNKLLEDHKREAEAAKKAGDEAFIKNSQILLEQFSNVTNVVSVLKDQTAVTQEKTAALWRTLASPAGAGYLAEVGLENSLKNLGLESGRDYIMQYSINNNDGGNLRPDAVIFLPQDMVMVIDSKSSKFILEIAETYDELSQSQALQNLKDTMNKHLRDLTSKNYSLAIANLYKESGRADKLSSILNVMYLPSENAVSHIKKADPEFVAKVEKAGIILAGPASLIGLLSLARLNIGMMRQAENQDLIVQNIQDLMDNIVTVLSYSDKLGRSIKSANDSFDQFAKSVNSRMLPKMRKLIGLGINPAKSKDLPNRITSYDIRPADDMPMIENSLEEA